MNFGGLFKAAGFLLAVGGILVAGFMLGAGTASGGAERQREVEMVELHAQHVEDLQRCEETGVCKSRADRRGTPMPPVEAP